MSDIILGRQRAADSETRECYSHYMRLYCTKKCKTLSELKKTWKDITFYLGLAFGWVECSFAG